MSTTAEEQREMARVRSLRYYYSHKKEVQARNDAWWRAHPEKLKEKVRRRSLRRREKLKAYRKIYRSKNREKLNAASRKWLRTEAGKLAIARHNHVRRCRKLGLQSNNLGIAEWMRQVRQNPFMRCHWCGTKVSGRRIHFDHVIALSNGGSHAIGNLCAACPDCNRSKSSRALSNWLVNNQAFLPL